MNVAFIDRDGTLIWEPPETQQIDALEKLRILPGVIEGMKLLKKRGFKLVMVSNQNGIGTTSFPRKKFEEPHKKFLGILKSAGIVFDQIFICPHLPKERCACRKPRIGLVTDYLKKNAVNLSTSLMIGDRDTDEAFAKNIGVRFVRMKTNDRFPRFASFHRTTKETDIDVFLNVDGSGETSVCTGIGFFDHMLSLLAKHALIDVSLQTKGDIAVDEHHTIEDTALALGSALAEALGDKRGIERYGFLLPMDEALAEIALDLSGRPSLVFEGEFKREYVGEMPTELVEHFFASFTQALRCNLHMTIRRGKNEHHKIEALFKGLGRCLRQAFRGCPHERGIPSTKGFL